MFLNSEKDWVTRYLQGVNGTADCWEDVGSASKVASECCQVQTDIARGSEIEAIGDHTESPDQKFWMLDTVPECVQLVQLYMRKPIDLRLP